MSAFPKQSYREAKEAFVSQLQGGSIYRINVVSWTALSTYTLWACLRNRGVLFDGALGRKADGSSNRRRVWLAELLILVLPVILAVTILSDHLLVLNMLLGITCWLVLHFFPSQAYKTISEKSEQKHWSKRHSDDDDDEDDVFGAVGGSSFHTAAVRDDPLRVSVDSAADSALAAAAPPTQFVPPGVDESNYSGHSSQVSISSECGQDLQGLGLQTIKTKRKHISTGSPLRQSTAESTFGSSAATLLSTPPRDSITIKSSYVPRNQPFLSVYRAHMMLMTIVCILAVDFPAFPREFAKCETWGTSLMDLGVGSFVFSMGIVSALPLLRSPSQRFKPLRAQLFRDARRSLPLLALGLIRVIMVKGVEYPEHVSEYGVHWNFFITLALLPFFGTLCRPLTRITRYSVLGLSLLCIHQILISMTPLGAWAASNSPAVRARSLLSQNKEGLVSFPGYLAIFLLGMDLGLYVLPRDPYFAHRRPSKSRKKEKTDKLAMLLASFSILWWTAYYAEALVLRSNVSRRLANLPYVFWVTAYNTTFLLFYVVIYMVLLQPLDPLGETDVQVEEDLLESKTPLLLTSLNYAAFLVFLAANLLTGLVNVSMQTMYTSHTVAVIILTLYISLCLSLATQIHARRWKLPF